MEANREKGLKDLSFLPLLPVPLPLIDVVAVGTGGSFTTPGGGIPSGFCDCCVGDRLVGFVIPILGV